jgi:hypothetical protein
MGKWSLYCDTIIFTVKPLSYANITILMRIGDGIKNTLA